MTHARPWYPLIDLMPRCYFMINAGPMSDEERRSLRWFSYMMWVYFLLLIIGCVLYVMHYQGGIPYWLQRAGILTPPPPRLDYQRGKRVVWWFLRSPLILILLFALYLGLRFSISCMIRTSNHIMSL